MKGLSIMLVGLLSVGLISAIAPLSHNIAASNKLDLPFLNPAIRVSAGDMRSPNHRISLIARSNGIEADNPCPAYLIFQPRKTISRGTGEGITLESGFLLNHRVQFSPDSWKMVAYASPFRVASRNMIASRGEVPADIFVTACGSPAVVVDYSVALNENMDTESTISILNKSEVKIIRDLAKPRYLNGLKKNPGMDRLRNDVEISGLTKQFQPNFTYTTRNLAEWVKYLCNLLKRRG